MAVEGKPMLDRARALALPIELVSCAAENRGMPRFIFPDGKIDNRLMPSGHLSLQSNP